MTHPDGYYVGIRLFNEEHYWHAHEQWEECWLGSPEPDNTFYKGIIQAAAALYHWQKGNLRGLHRNWEKSRNKLVGLTSPYMGMNLEQFIGAMDVFVEGVGRQADFPPSSMLALPRLAVEWG